MITLNLTGRLTRDPELRNVADPAGGGMLDVCHLRVAARDRRGDPVYIDRAEWGASGRAAADCLRKGSMIGFTGELRFRETSGDNGARQYLSAVGHVEFLDRRLQQQPEQSEVPVPLEASEDDIPF